VTLDEIEFICVPVGIAIAGFIYNVVSKYTGRIDAMVARCDLLEKKMIEDYVKKVEMQAMLMDVRQAFAESVGHLREDLRLLLNTPRAIPAQSHEDT
jgi:hypothetical protein